MEKCAKILSARLIQNKQFELRLCYTKTGTNKHL